MSDRDGVDGSGGAKGPRPMNGQGPGAAQPSGPELTIPILRVHYKQDQNGVRQVQGVELGGSLLGNVVSINAGFDAGKPGALPGNVVRCTMEVLWPVEWVDVNRGPDLVVARSVPPAFPR